MDEDRFSNLSGHVDAIETMIDGLVRHFVDECENPSETLTQLILSVRRRSESVRRGGGHDAMRRISHEDNINRMTQNLQVGYQVGRLGDG